MNNRTLNIILVKSRQFFDAGAHGAKDNEAAELIANQEKSGLNSSKNTFVHNKGWNRPDGMA